MTQVIPPHILAAWQRGDKVVAIKMLRESSNLGLAEAKDLLETHAALHPINVMRPPMAPASIGSEGVNDFLPAINAALASGNKLEAIRLLSAGTGVGLKEAKDRIDAADPSAWQHQPPPSSPSQTSQQHSPGEVSNSNWLWVVLILALAIGAGVWYYLNKP